MSILSKDDVLEKVNTRIYKFFLNQQIGKLLKRSNFYKESGYSCDEILRFIFQLAFTGKNLYHTLQTNDCSRKLGKDAIYRFLNSCRFNWRKLLLKLSSSIIKEQVSPLTSC